MPTFYDKLLLIFFDSVDVCHYSDSLHVMREVQLLFIVFL